MISPLEIIIAIPLLAAALIGFGLPARLIARIAALANLLLIVGLTTRFVAAPSELAFVASHPILDNPAIAFAVGADGVSLAMALLTGIVTFAAVWQICESQPRLFFVAALLISGGALGAFLCTDLFFIYGFHELALIPTLLAIALHGHGDATNRRAIAWKITVYLGVGSLILLAGLAALVLNYSSGPQLTFDLIALKATAAKAALPQATQAWIMFTLVVGFGTLVSLFPFHSWAAPAYAAAPTPVAMMHSGVLKKFGLYGLLRIAIPLLPQGLHVEWVQHALLLMLLGNIIVIGFVTIHQDRLDSMIGNSSVMHMGYIFLGLVAGNEIALKGSVLLMFGHGLSVALLFALCGKMRAQLGTLEFAKLGGLASNAPFLAVVFGFATFASLGLPGLANFAGEVMVFFGAFETQQMGQNNALGWLQWSTILALWGVVMSAVYMLRAYRGLFFGQPASGLFLSDPAGFSARLPLVLLAACLLIFGCCPSLLLGLIQALK